MNNDVTLKVGFDIDKFTSELQKTQSLVSGWGSNIQGQLTRAFSMVGGVYLFKQGMESAIRSMADFEKSMSEVKAITGATGAEFQTLRDNALNLAGAFKAIDISKMETELGRLGFSTREILDSSKAVITLASATGSNLADSATIAASTLRAFNLDAKEMGRVTDVMAGALNRTGLDMSNFAEAIKYVAPNAHAANISLEETAAILGVLADNGIKGSMAGTVSRRIIQDLAKDTRPLIDRLQELAAKGINASDALDEVGRIGSTGLLILAKNTDRLIDLKGAFHNVTGEAEAMSKVMQDNLIGDWNKFNAEIDKFLNKKGSTGFFRDLTQQMRNQIIVWTSESGEGGVTWLEKILGGAGDYERFAALIEKAREKALQTAKDFNSEYKEIFKDTSVKGFAGQFGLQALATVFPYKRGAIPSKVDPDRTPTPDPYSHAAAIAASAGRTYGDTTTFPDNTMGMASLKGWAELNSELNLTGDALTSVQESLNGIKTQADAATMKNLNDGWKQEEKSALNFASHMRNIGASLRQEFARIGVGISDALAGAINGTQSFAESMAQIIGQVISQLEALAISYIIAAAAKDALFLGGPGGVIAAIAGIVVASGLIKSMFSGLGGHSSSSVSGGSMQSARVGDYTMAPQVLQINGTLKAQGSDMVYTFEKQGYRVSRVGG